MLSGLTMVLATISINFDHQVHDDDNSDTYAKDSSQTVSNMALSDKHFFIA